MDSMWRLVEIVEKRGDLPLRDSEGRGRACNRAAKWQKRRGPGEQRERARGVKRVEVSREVGMAATTIIRT